jgi:hypothetical protein
MHADLDIAWGLLQDQTKARRQFDRRFRELLDRALEHCHEAVAIGLDRERYVSGVARAASEALLRSLPLAAEEARLDPFVRRVCSRREFGLTLLLNDDRDAAWDLVARRFEAFTGALLLRRGIPGAQVEAERNALFAELRRPDAEGRRPISSYLGRSDFRDWLFVYVRTRFRTSLGAGAEGTAPEAGSIAGSEETPVPDSERARELAAAWRPIAGALRDAMNDENRALVEGLARGLPLEAERASRDLTRHRELINRFFQRVTEALAARLGRPRREIDEDLRGLLVGEMEAHLRQVSGGEGSSGVRRPEESTS